MKMLHEISSSQFLPQVSVFHFLPMPRVRAGRRFGNRFSAGA